MSPDIVDNGDLLLPNPMPDFDSNRSGASGIDGVTTKPV
jgi:hypothetical protein